MARLPEGFVVPPQAKLDYAGEGDTLPYRLVWTSALPEPDVAELYQRMVTEGVWELLYTEQTAPDYRVRLGRIGEGGEMTHWAMLAVSPTAAGGSRVELEFILTGGGVALR
jgi:hypothetical protein